MLPESPGDRQPISVSALVGAIRSLVHSGFGVVRVLGEISNFSRPASGHCYFTLKDEDAQIRCALFRSDAQRLRFTPQDGMQVIVFGRVDVYEQRGELQLRAMCLQPAGVGALQKAFEELKRKLHAEGLFSRKHKRPLPRFPNAIGMVTSSTGAAITDLLTVIGRRFPIAEVIICPVPVQGFGAAERIAEAIRTLNRLDPSSDVRPDVIVVGRGGGSAEDLWPFNEEVVARAIYASEIPIVSAVGHETDISITDFVADVRAATPSMAAEIIVPDRAELIRQVATMILSARTVVARSIQYDRQRVRHTLRSYGFGRPKYRLEQLSRRTDELTQRMVTAMANLVDRHRERVRSAQKHLDALDPARTMERGYVRVERDGEAIVRSHQLQTRDEVLLRFFDGSREAQIISQSDSKRNKD